jgi:ribosomal protein S18 acetylase RimI-like enzyme
MLPNGFGLGEGVCRLCAVGKLRQTRVISWLRLIKNETQIEALNKIIYNSEGMENIYKQITKIISEEVKNKQMGCIYRCLLQKSINEKLFYKIEENGQIQGFAICRYLKTKNILSIDKIGVHPDFRKSGIGSKIIAEIKKQFDLLRIDVVTENINAINFYKKNGFKIVGNKILGKNINVTIMYYE